MCALRISEATLQLGEERSYIPEVDSGVEAELMDHGTRSAHIGSFATAVNHLRD